MTKHACQGASAIVRPLLREHSREHELLQGLIASMDHPAAPIERLAVGRRFVAVASNGRLGLASTLGARPNPEDEARLAEIQDGALMDAAGLLLQEQPLPASVGLAALNAGMDVPLDARRLGAEELLMEQASGQRVVVVGDFPFVARLSRQAADVQVLELRPGAGTLQRRHWGDALASCQVAAITSTALLTRSMAWLLASAPQALKVVIGPSTPWSAWLLEQGVDILAGSRVLNRSAVIDAVAAGLPFHQIKRQGVESLCWGGLGHEMEP